MAKKAKVPACEEDVPEILPENIDAIKIWNMVRGQRIIDAGGNSIDIIQSAVWEALDRFRINNPAGCFLKVLTLSRVTFADERTQREQERLQEQDKQREAAEAKRKAKRF